MASTNYPLNHPQAVKKWSGEVFKQALKNAYSSRFMGTGSSALCQIRNELKDYGDRIRVGLRMQLTGAGRSADATLEGYEEALEIYHDDVYIDQLRHAVRSAGKMSEQRVPFSVRDEAKDGLADWWADRFDYWFFNQISGNSDQTDTRYTGMQSAIAPTNAILPDATSTASLAAADVFSIKHIDYALEYGEDTATYPFRPMKMGGKDYYCVFVHTVQATDLRRNFTAGEWGDIQRAAIEGGKTSGSPIFSGSLGEYAGTVIHKTTRLPTAGGQANTRRAVFAGAQAACMAFGKGSSSGNKFSWVEELFDYGNQLGVSGGTIAGLKKTQFNAVDFATLVIPTYAAAHT